MSWVSRWLFSTNHKNIGTLYIMFGIFSALIGTMLSILIRVELTNPGTQIFQSGQLYNVIVTSRALVMSVPMCCKQDLERFLLRFLPSRPRRDPGMKYFEGRLIKPICRNCTYLSSKRTEGRWKIFIRNKVY